MSELGAEWPKVIYRLVLPRVIGNWQVDNDGYAHRDEPPFDGSYEAEEVIPTSVAEELATALDAVIDMSGFLFPIDQATDEEKEIGQQAADALSRYRSLVGDKQKEEPRV